jgi:serine/threonine protein kinase
MIVHRDLKPSNILITRSGRVKLVDFGIAKLLDPVDGLAAEPLTRTGLQVMTPEYASPEQVAGGMVTAASDVYQLGVVLYELLTGSRPHRLTGSTSAEIERTICEKEPEAPSQAVAAGDSSLEEVAAARGSRPERLVSQLNGDIDTIVLMALRKEPERRYQSVEQLIRDIERHLAGRPISATHEAHGSLRVMPPCFATGQAAGTAAALALETEVAPRAVDVDLLRKSLEQQGALV